MSQPTDSQKKKIIIGMVIAFLAIYGTPYLIDAIIPEQAPADSKQSTAEASEAPKPSLVGGAFSLQNQQGEPTTEAALNGRWSLVFFGFTQCPDICPVALMSMSEAIEQLESEGFSPLPQPIFITLDPERDTPQTLSEYATNFHPSLVALTGTPEQVKQAADAYKVYFQKTPLEDSAMAYTVDHSGYIYLMDTEGRYVRHFAHNVDPTELATEFKETTP